MELVRGIPITEFCDRNKISVRQRLELFVSVVQAIQHAHQKGVIHRDIKPTNVLVTLHDGVPVAKVIDFGIAKAAGQQLTEKTLFTNFAQMIGTPLYMSPEQAEMSGLDVDTRSDIYSLGVLLYELLTGTTPFDKEQLKKAGFDEVRRIIREDEPARPSARVSTLGEAAATVSANRGSDPARLCRLIRGELDWVVMKALEKDRNRRYDTASALAADIRRYLADETVQACPPSSWYRFRKLARRNKAALAAGTAVAAGVLVAFVSLGGAVRVLTASNERIKSEQAQTGAALGRAKKANESLKKSLAREELTAYAQRTVLAGRELSAGNVGHAEELLDQCPEYLRGWEWHFLKGQRYGNIPPFEHHVTVVRVLLSPDGEQTVSACMDGTIEARDARTGRVLHTIEQPSLPIRHRLIRSMAYSLDGRYLAVARNDGAVKVWDARSWLLLHTLEAHRGTCWHVAFSPDSEFLASGGADNKVRLWDVADGKPIHEYSDLPAAVQGVAFRPDGRSLVAACQDGTLKTWDCESHRETFSFRGDVSFPMRPSFSPDARCLAWSEWDGDIKVWDTTTGKLEITHETNAHQIRAVVFSPDGKRLALAGFDGTLRLLDATTGQEMHRIFAHNHSLTDAAFNRDGNRLASASYDHTVRIWDADPPSQNCITLATGHQQLVSGVAFSPDPDGRWLATSSWDGTVKLWERRHATPDDYTLRYTLRGHTARVVGVAFSSDNRTLVTGSWDKSVRLWDRHSPQGDSLTELRPPIPCTERVISFAVSPDGRMLAVGQMNGVALYDPATGQEVAPLKLTPAPVPSVTFSPDNQQVIASGASDPVFRIWDIAGQEALFTVQHNPNSNACVAISPDGRLLATPSRDLETGQPGVNIWDAETRVVRRTLKGHVGYVWRVIFSPDGRYLASGSWDSKVKVWDLSDESAEPVTLHGHAGYIHGLAFSRDGRRLASSSGYASHGEVKIWDAKLWERPDRHSPLTTHQSPPETDEGRRAP
jgi:WD40 repeat protein